MTMKDNIEKIAEEYLKNHSHEFDTVVSEIDPCGFNNVKFAAHFALFYHEQRMEEYSDEKVKDIARIIANNSQFLSDFPHDYSSVEYGAIKGIKKLLSDLTKTEKCNGKCGMNYCDEYGCVDNRRPVQSEPDSLTKTEEG